MSHVSKQRCSYFFPTDRTISISTNVGTSLSTSSQQRRRVEVLPGAQLSMPSSSATTLPHSIPDPGGQGVWEARKDQNTGRIFWVNHTLRKTQWESPKPADPAPSQPTRRFLSVRDPPTAPGLNPALDELPDNWERRFDPQTGDRSSSFCNTKTCACNGA